MLAAGKDKLRDLAENSVSLRRTAGRRIKEACSNVGLAACREESSESGSGHSTRLLGFEANNSRS